MFKTYKSSIHYNSFTLRTFFGVFDSRYIWTFVLSWSTVYIDLLCRDLFIFNLHLSMTAQKRPPIHRPTRQRRQIFHHRAIRASAFPEFFAVLGVLKSSHMKEPIQQRLLIFLHLQMDVQHEKKQYMRSPGRNMRVLEIQSIWWENESLHCAGEVIPLPPLCLL